MRRRSDLTRLPVTSVLLAALGVTTVLSVWMVAQPVSAHAGNECTLVHNPNANNKTMCRRGADLAEVQWSYYQLNYAFLIEVNLSSANLFHANLSHAALVNSDLDHANVEEANLSDAQVLGAKLRGTNLKNANLSGALLNSADLTFADLKGATTTGADFMEAKWDDTICPGGTNSRDYNPQTCVGHGIRN